MAGSKIFSTTFLVLLMIMMISYTAESALLDLDITKADVGNNGDIVKVKPTRVSVAKKGDGLARVDTGGISVGKDGSIADVAANTISVAKKGRPIIGAGKVHAHVLKGSRH